MVMASSKPLPCGPCLQGKLNTKAENWCHNCDEGLCSTCCGHHKRSKGTRDHKTIAITSYKPSIGDINTECDKHGQQLNLYCPSHLMPCCDQCINSSHSKCTGIISLASVVEKTEIGKSKESVEKDINSILHILDKIVNNKSTNIKTGEQQCKDIKESMVKIREKMNKHLDQLEKKLCEEANNIWEQEKSTILHLTTEIKHKKENLIKMKDNLKTVISSSSKLESFLGLHQNEQQVHQYRRYVEDLENDDRAKQSDIKMKQNDEIESILHKLESLKSHGELMIVKTETDFNRETSVKRKAQVQSREQSNIKNMTMNIETKIEINMKKQISDMICLIDGRIIVAKENGKINLLTSDGKLQKQLPLPGRANGVTQINQNTIAITYPHERAIKIFDIENDTVTKVITLDKACYGLSFSNNSLAVGLDRDESRIIDLEGNTLKSIQIKSESLLDHLVYCNDRVIYSDWSGNAVYCVDGSGEQIWQYTQDLKGPKGLCTDTYGNIIVPDWSSNRIIVISKDGQDSKVLIGREDGLLEPKCICFNHNESSGFICDHMGSLLAKFNLSSG